MNSNKGKIVIGCILAVSSFVVIVFVIGHLEMYFYPCPNIDTQYSERYSEDKFGSIKIGDNYSDGMLGKPLWVQEKNNGTLVLWYSNDGKCWWGDFAWNGRALVIKDGVICEKIKKIYYD